MGNHLWPFESASGLSSSQASGECLSGRGGASPWIFPWIILVYLGVSFRLQIFDMNSFPWYVHIIIVIDICIGIYTISLSLYIYSPYIYSKELWFSHGPSAIFPPMPSLVRSSRSSWPSGPQRSPWPLRLGQIWESHRDGNLMGLENVNHRCWMHMENMGW